MPEGIQPFSHNQSLADLPSSFISCKWELKYSDNGDANRMVVTEDQTIYLAGGHTWSTGSNGLFFRSNDFQKTRSDPETRSLPRDTQTCLSDR